MTECRGARPTVFVVDSQAQPLPLPPKPGRWQAQRSRNLAQTWLFLLVSVALLGVVVEACFIYRFYTQQNSSLQTVVEGPRIEARKGKPQKNGSTDRPKQRPLPVLKPLKPLAHLVAGSNRPNKDGIVLWNDVEPEVHNLEYKKGQLIIPTEGYYYVYSKLCFSLDDATFHYSVMNNATRYTGPPVQLLRYRLYLSKSVHKDLVGNGYLGGVFHLIKGDAVFVQVSNSNSLRLQYASDNFFGLFML